MFSIEKFNSMNLIFVSIVLLSCRINANNDDYKNSVMRTVIRVNEECRKTEGGYSPCLKKKAITFIDRVLRIDSINIDDDIKIVRTGKQKDNNNNNNYNNSYNNNIVDDKNSEDILTEKELEQTLPRSLETREQILTNMLIERVANFFNGRTIQINLPQISSEQLGRGLEEGRGKMKKMAGMMMMGMMMKMAGMIPMAMAGLYMLAGKALIISKIALLLAGIIAIKKLIASKQGGGGGGGGGHSSGGGGGGGWSSSGGGGGGGWDRRSIESITTGQNLAYNAYNTENARIEN